MMMLQYKKFQFVCLTCLYLVVVVLQQCRLSFAIANPKSYHIGAVLSSPENVDEFEKAIADIQYPPGKNVPRGVTLYGHAILKQYNPIEDVKNFCQNLTTKKVSVVIIDDRIPSEAITFTSSLHNIPIIGLTNRECIFSDKSLYGSYMRTSSVYSHQADVWVELLTHLNYECVHFLVSDSINGRNIKQRFISLADSSNIDIETVVEYNHNRPYIMPELQAIYEKNSSCRIYVLYAERHNSEDVLDQIQSLNMSSSDYVWIVSEQSLTAPNLPIGFLGVRYKDWDNISGHINDSVHVIAGAIKAMYRQANFTTPRTDCRNIGAPKWLEGDIFYDYLREEKQANGSTGKVGFDERGDRLYGEYDILNSQYAGKKLDNVNDNQRLSNNSKDKTTTILVNVGNYTRLNETIKVQLHNDTMIVWPGNLTVKPVGYSMPNHLRIVTIAETPFVWVMAADPNGNCASEQIPCPIKRKKSTKTNDDFEELFCCEGYCIDLLKTLATQLNFTYQLYQVADGLYGSYAFNRETRHNEWTGLLGELYYGHADMVVGALTITPERSLAIDFTKPFKYQGMTILQKRQSIHRLRHPLTSFLQPFQNSLWVSVFVSVHVVALALYLLDRFSPFGRYKLPNCEQITEEDALNLSSAIWFAWGVLFNSGIGEGTPRSFSGRVLGMIWAGFAMIVVASYTANLAAFLVLDRPETALTGINDPRFRNPIEGFNYSTVRESSVDLYFRRQVELAPMYKRMSNVNFDNAEDAIIAVKTGTLNAFIWDSARLEYEAAKDCELSISGELFGRSGYAIGLPKNRPYWKDKVTMALLGMHEIGFMEDLDNKWILLEEQICEGKAVENFPPTLGLKNMAGVFIMVGTGILGGVGLIMFEIFYKRHQTRKQKRLELARNAVDRWKEMIENRKLLIESLNMTARQRYKERHQIHRRRQPLQNSSKSLSDEKTYSLSSSDTGTGTTVCLQPLQQQQQSKLASNNRNCNNNNNSSSGSIEIRKPPTYLDLTDTNHPASGVSTFSTRRPIDPSEQHPNANARIYHHHQPQQHPKPRLCREFSVTEDNEYEPYRTFTQPPSAMIENIPPPPTSSAKHRTTATNYINLV